MSRLLPLCILAAFIPACAPHAPPAAGAAPSRFQAPAAERVAQGDVVYRVAAPDVLEIRAPGVRQLHGLLATVQPNGQISAGPLGDLPAAGLTALELSAELTTRLRDHTVDSTLPPGLRAQVNVVEYASQSYTVIGSAAPHGGRKPFTGSDTVVSALIDAGFNHQHPKWPEQVAIQRPARHSLERETKVVEIGRMLKSGDMRQNYLLEPGDVIYVPD